MILMSKYKGQHGGKKGQKIRARTPPFWAMPERNQFFFCEVFPNNNNDDQNQNQELDPDPSEPNRPIKGNKRPRPK